MCKIKATAIVAHEVVAVLTIALASRATRVCNFATALYAHAIRHRMLGLAMTISAPD
jgi:hypothetical protein